MIEYKAKPEYFIVGTLEGLLLFKKENSDNYIVKIIKSFVENVRWFGIDENHNIWSEKDLFEPDTKLNEQINNKDVWISNYDNEENIWFCGQEIMGGLIKNNDTYEYNHTPFHRFKASLLQHLYAYNSDTILFCFPEQSYLYYPKIEKNYKPALPCLIRKVEFLNTDDSLNVIFGGTYNTENGYITKQTKDFIPEIEYNKNSLRFQFSAPVYEKPEELKFSYYLEGYEEHWREWNKISFKEYTNLKEGKYIFHIKAKNIYELETEEAIYEFVILCPWYRTILSYIAYFIIAVLFIALLIKLFTIRLEKQKNKLEKTVLERTSEIRQQKEEILVQNENLLQQKEEIQTQKEEISVQADNLKEANVEILSQNEKIELAYNNIKNLSKIGRKIISNLNLQEIFNIAYDNTITILELNTFAIGIYNDKINVINFIGTIINSENQEFYSQKLSDDLLSNKCFNEQVEFIDAQIKTKNIKISAELNYKQGSFILLPLKVKDKKIGVIYIQNNKHEYYTDYHLNMLRNISNYISIAIDNADTYRIIKNQHTQIQSSVRYAKTIQTAILPLNEKIKQNLDCFIIYRPKDIVSGDFYWYAEIKSEKNEEFKKSNELNTDRILHSSFFILHSSFFTLNSSLFCSGRLHWSRDTRSFHEYDRKLITF